MFISRRWRFPKVIYGLILFEFPLTVACLALTGIASPDLYRTILWKEGNQLGFNSSPSTVIYAFANYRPVHVPLVWSSFTTRFNLVISVLSMFILLVKLTMHITNVLYPIIALFIHALLAALWAYSVHAQVSPDTIETDPALQNHGAPWYLKKGCGPARTSEIKGYCMQAQGVFAVSCVSLGLFAIWLAFSIWSLIPTRDQKAARASKILDREEKSLSTPMTPEERWQHQWEMGQIPRTPGATETKFPTTPRTTAFNKLGGGDLPFRK